MNSNMDFDKTLISKYKNNENGQFIFIIFNSSNKCKNNMRTFLNNQFWDNIF